MKYLLAPLTPIRTVWRFMLRPTAEFAGSPTELGPIVRTVAAYLGLLLIPIGLSSIQPWLTLRAVGSPAQALARIGIVDFNPFLYLFPLNLLFFPFAWLGAMFAGGLLRSAFTSILGEPNRSVPQMIAFSGICLMPMATVGMFLRTLGNVLPWRALVNAESLIAVRLAMTVALFAAAWLWEGRMLVAALRAQTGQNTGRAVLTWLWPYVIVLGSGWLLLTILGMFGGTE